MTAQNGALVLVKCGDGAMPEVFTTIGGLRISAMALNNHILDASNREAGIWRQLLSGAGAQSLTIHGSGLFTNSAAEERVRSNAFAASANNYRFYFANGNYIVGAFVITHYERVGDYEDAEQYALTLENAGAISFFAS